jgi:hypothetical protein
MKYIFVAGAPGSKWSSVVKNIYYSEDIDHSDHTDQRTYSHGEQAQLHQGAYWDPGMEFGNFFDQLDQYTKEQCEHEFDRPFSGTGIRIIKSHSFAHHVDTIRERWPDCAIVLVHRSSDSCLGWWVKCGGFDIKYPSYRGYYKDLPTMSRIIGEQNFNIESAMNHHSGPEPKNNHELGQILGLTLPPNQGTHDYDMADIKVKVLVPTKHS